MVVGVGVENLNSLLTANESLIFRFIIPKSLLLSVVLIRRSTTDRTAGLRRNYLCTVYSTTGNKFPTTSTTGSTRTYVTANAKTNNEQCMQLNNVEALEETANDYHLRYH